MRYGVQYAVDELEGRRATEELALAVVLQLGSAARHATHHPGLVEPAPSKTATAWKASEGKAGCHLECH